MSRIGNRYDLNGNKIENYANNPFIAKEDAIVGGKYCIDTKNALLKIGNGTDDNHRSNAFEVTKDGDSKIAGNLSAANINCTNQGNDTSSVIIKQTLDTHIASINTSITQVNSNIEQLANSTTSRFQSTNNTINSHISNKTNPHSVNLTQVGGNSITLNGVKQVAGANVSFYAPSVKGYINGTPYILISGPGDPVWSSTITKRAFVAIEYKVIDGGKYTRRGVFNFRPNVEIVKGETYEGVDVFLDLELSGTALSGIMYMGDSGEQTCAASLTRTGNSGYIIIYRRDGNIDRGTINSIKVLSVDSAFAVLC